MKFIRRFEKYPGPAADARAAWRNRSGLYLLAAAAFKGRSLFNTETPIQTGQHFPLSTMRALLLLVAPVLLLLASCEAPEDTVRSQPVKDEAHVVVPGTRLGPVALGAQQAEVHAALGAPDRMWRMHHDGSPVEVDAWEKEGDDLVVYSKDDQVVQILATGPDYATSDGLSTRSTLEKVRTQHTALQSVMNPYENGTLYYHDQPAGVAFGVATEAGAVPEKEVGEVFAIFVHRPGEDVLLF